MTRWQQRFGNHQFRDKWSKLKEALNITQEKVNSSPEDVAEYARLSKVVELMDNFIDYCDPDMIPIGFWDNIDSLIQNTLGSISNFNNDGNRTHLHQANSHLDNLLSSTSPYMFLSGKVARSMRGAFNKFQNTIISTLNNFSQTSKELLSEISKNKQESANYLR